IEYVHEAMAHPLILGLLNKVETEEIIPYIAPVPDTDLGDYFRLIVERFSNPEVADTERRLCLDGSNRQPKFIVPSIRDALAAGGSVEGLALVSALWCRYCAGTTESGATIAPNDPHWTELTERAQAARHRPEAWLDLQAVYGELGRNPSFGKTFSGQLQQIWSRGVHATLENYLSASR
nr:mannitol dehydrogenase family protein [Tabrizicola sp.]